MNRRDESGMALISVVGVLVLLGLVVTPFMITQRDSALRGERLLYNARADAEAESLFDLTRSELMRSIEQVEAEKLEKLGVVAGAEGSSRPPESATPSSDTLAEFELSPETLARFNATKGTLQRVWDVDVVDLQSLPNLNACSAPFLANVIGRSELADNISADTDSIPVVDGTVFPEKGGVVRIGAETVKYAQVQGNLLTGCERGFGVDKGNSGPATSWESGDPVFLEAAVQLAIRPFTARKGRWTRYTNIYQARSISDAGVAALPIDRFDRLRGQVSVFSGNVVGDGWCNPQLVEEAIVAGTSGAIDVDVKNPAFMGPGTLVRITDGVNSDYAMVAKVKGDQKLTLLGKIEHSYDANQAFMYSLARSPVNLNTASVETLALVFEGLKLRGVGVAIDRTRATNLATKLKAWNNTEDETAKPGTFRSWSDFVRALDQLRDEGVISPDDAAAVLRNAMNSNDARLQFSTVPFCFRSYDLFEVRATAMVLAGDGRALARREVRRVLSAGTGRSGVLRLESQDDFQRQIMKSRDAKWWASYPDNVNAYYDGANIPASEFQAFMQKARFPSTSRAAAEGDLQLLPGSWRYVGRADRVHHFDESDKPDGLELEEASFDLTVSDTYNTKDKTVDLIQLVEIPNRGEAVETGVKPFCLSFWYRPRWSRGGQDQVLFDYGDDDDFMNRVSLRYLGDRDMLVLGVADATREQRAYEVFYDFEHHTWEPDQWYHIAVAVRGAGPGLCDLFIDGESVGEATGITRLTSQVPADGDSIALSVESTDGFPDDGVLFLQSEDGAEFMEYVSKTKNSFQVVRRKARNIAATQMDDNPRGHPDQTVVELYGYTAPLFTDIRRGGASIPSRIGPWRVYRIAMPEDTSVTDRIDITTTTTPPSTTTIWGIGSSANNSDAYPGVTLTDWETGANDANVLQDLGQTGAEGLALIVCGGGGALTNSSSVLISQGPNQSETVDGQLGFAAEIVRYRVGSTPGTVDLVQRRVNLAHTQSMTGSSGAPFFIPNHDYGDTSSPQSIADNNGNLGWMSAFIPIGLIGQGNNAEYLNPLDEETQLDLVQSERFAYVQVDGEWVKYDTYDTSVVPGFVAFYRDDRLDDVATLFNAAGALSVLAAIDSQSTGAAGGPGGPSSSSNVPPRVDDENAPTDLPAEAAGTPVLVEPAILSRDIALRLDFRGYIKDSDQQDVRVANTIPRVHEANTPIIPAFRIVSGNDFEPDAWRNQVRGAHAGWNDLCTLRDTGDSDQQVRVAWGWDGWAALSEVLGQTWGWDRPSDQNPSVTLRRYDARAFTRLIKFPSGELPDSRLTRNQERFQVGAPYSGGGVSAATIDELVMPALAETPDDRVAYAYLGSVPQEVIQIATGGVQAGGNNQIVDPRFPGIDDKADTIPVHLTIFDDGSNAIVVGGLPIAEDVFPDDGGMIRIDDELILYEEFDLEGGVFTGCLRGVMGTQPAPHSYNARVSAVQAFPTTVLTSPADESSAEFQLARTDDFPDDGYIRIGDQAEVIGYTERDGNSLSGPLGRIDPTTERDTGAEARVGGGLFRGRFGTKAAGYTVGDVAVAVPFRYYDRYAERSDHPEMSYAQFSWTKPGAIWKRVSWAQRPVENVEIIALLRFSGGPPWDSDQIVRVGAESIPKIGRRDRIYEISATGKSQLNLLNVEADRLEVRLLVRFADGAHRRVWELAGTGEPLPNAWKDTPWVKKLTVEYVAPTMVLSQE